MPMIKIFLYVAATAVLAVDVWVLWRLAEKIIRFIKRQAPFASSSALSRAAVVREINEHYPNMRRVCDIGSGHGGLARAIARGCGVSVFAFENMPLAALVSKIADVATRSGVHTIWCDAFARVAASDGFDIAVAYLGPDMGDRIAALRHRIRVLIALDFPVAGMGATRVVDLPGGGYTMYGDKKYPHKLFIYEF